MTDHNDARDIEQFAAARMAQHFERMNRPVKRGNPVAVVLLCAAVVAVLVLLT